MQNTHFPDVQRLIKIVLISLFVFAHCVFGISTITITDTAGQRDTQSALLESLDSVITTDTTSDVLANVGLENRFDKAAVMNEINLQVAVTQQFDQTMQGVKGEFNSALDDLKKELDDKKISQSEYDRKRKGLETASLIVSGIGGALSTPNSNGIVGDLAQIAAPHVAKQIGDYFAQSGNSNKAAHGLAHTVLAAAVAAAGGNDALTAGLSAGGAELAAPVVSKWLYGESDGSKLTSEQKQTISSITSLIGTAAGATTGNVTDIVASTGAATNAVDNNYLKAEELKSFAEEMGQCSTESCLQETITKYDEISDTNYTEAKKFCAENPNQCSERYNEIIVTILEKSKDQYYEALGRALDSNSELTESEKEQFGRLADLALRNAWIDGYGEQTDILASKFSTAIETYADISGEDEEQAAAMLGSVLFGMPSKRLTGNNWSFNSQKDVDLRNTGASYRDALVIAFEKTGVPREDFVVTKWGIDSNGKTIPTEYTAPNGANVNIDIPKFNNVKSNGSLGEGPHQPHIGYQTPGKKKNRIRGHIFVDQIPATRN